MIEAVLGVKRTLMLNMQNRATLSQDNAPDDNGLQDLRKIEQVYWMNGPQIMVLQLQDIYLKLGFSCEAARLLEGEQESHSPERLRVLIHKNVNDICNIVRKSGGKNADGMTNRWKQILAIAQENLMLVIFLFNDWLRCPFDMDITGV